MTQLPGPDAPSPDAPSPDAPSSDTPRWVAAARSRFSALQQGFAFFDAPGGSQVPDEVGEAIARAMREASANLGATYPTSLRVKAILERAEANAAALLGCEAHEVMFGASMTSLNFALSRTAGRELRAGDEILVATLDHDGGIAPWLELADDRELVVHQIARRPDTTLDLEDLQRKLSERTRVVAFAWASNAVGTIVDATEVCALAHSVGALAWVDAVHYAAHMPIDVRAIDADVLLCSSYKFCGPHLGVAYGRAELLGTWRPYKVRPAPTVPLGRRFDTGTPPYELLAGFNATIDYLEDVGGFAAIVPYERKLGELLLRSLPAGVELYGLTTMEGRVPTFLVNVANMPPDAVAARLAERQIGVWAHNNWYAVELDRQLGFERAVRIGLIHYNTPAEVQRLVAALRECAES